MQNEQNEIELDQLQSLLEELEKNRFNCRYHGKRRLMHIIVEKARQLGFTVYLAENQNGY